MRFSTLAVLGVSAIALSGCSFLGDMIGYNGGHAVQNQSYGQYQYAKRKNKCCVGGNALSRWNVEGALGGAFLVGGDGITGSRTNIPTSNIKLWRRAWPTSVFHAKSLRKQYPSSPLC